MWQSVNPPSLHTTKKMMYMNIYIFCHAGCTEPIPFTLFPVRTINEKNQLIQIRADTIRMDISGNVWTFLEIIQKLNGLQFEHHIWQVNDEFNLNIQFFR